MPKFIKVNHAVDGNFTSTEVNDLEKRIGDAVDPMQTVLDNMQFKNDNVKKFTGSLPTATGNANVINVDVSSVGAFPFVIAFTVRNANNVRLLGHTFCTVLQGGNGMNLQIQLNEAGLAGRQYEILVVRNV